MTTCSTGPCWTASTINANFTVTSAITFNNLWILGGYNPSNGHTGIQYSSDGANWTTVSFGYIGGSFVKQFVVGNGLVFGMVDAEKHILSSDGINWTVHTHFPPVSGEQSLCFGNGYFTFRASDSLAYSSDGINWSETPGPNNIGLRFNRAMVFGNGLFVGSGSGGFCYTNSVSVPLSYGSTVGGPSLLAYGNGVFIGLDSGLGSTNTVYRSTDGINWTAIPNGIPIGSGFEQFYNSLIFAQDRFLACKIDSNVLAVSADGLTWDLTTGDSLFDAGTNTGQTVLATDGNGQYIAANVFNNISQVGICPCFVPPVGDFWVRMDNVKLTSVKIGFETVVPPPIVCDPYWADVIFLLSGNGTLGSTTVIDDGPLALPFATEWGTWTYTDAETKYYPTSLIGTPTGALSTTIPPIVSTDKSWTWESWFYATSSALAGSGSGMSFLTNFDISWAIMTRGPGNGGNNEWGLVQLFTSAWVTTPSPLPADTWTYLTITYEDTAGAPGHGGTLRIFINGVLVTTQSYGSIPIGWEGQKVWIGPTANSFFTSNNYYFSDMRFTRGVARYTTSFTPPSTTLPQIGCP